LRNSPAWREICRRYGPCLTHSELICLAEVVALNLNLTLCRAAKRKKKNLVGWFDENFEQIQPFLNRVLLFDIDGQPIQNAQLPTGTLHPTV
jgi:hypothetical protein